MDLAQWMWAPVAGTVAAFWDTASWAWWFHTPVQNLSEATGLPADKARCLIALALTYLLALPLRWFHPARRVISEGAPPGESIAYAKGNTADATGAAASLPTPSPSPQPRAGDVPHNPVWVEPAPLWSVRAKHWYMVSCSLLLLALSFPAPSDTLHLVGACAATWVALQAGQTLRWSPRVTCTLAWLIVMGHMSYSHLARQLSDYGGYRFDHTAPQMVLVLKLTSVAWAVYDWMSLHREDGRRKRDDDEMPAKDPLPMSYTQRKAATPVPSPLELLAYALYFGGFLVGPAFDLQTFRDFVTGDVFLPPHVQVVPSAKASGILRAQDAKGEPRKWMSVHMPAPWFAALRCLLVSAFFMGSVVLYADHYGFHRLMRVPGYTDLPTSFSDFAWKFARLNMAGLSARLQYYAIWKLAEGSCMISGVAFSSPNKWDAISNVDIVNVEFATAIKGLIDHWNMGTSRWLKHHVYERASAGGWSSGACVILTYTISAMWHGFYPGYYLTFFTGAIVTVAARNLRRALRPRVLARGEKAMAVYAIVGWIFTQFAVNYMVAPFLLLDLRTSWAAWRANLCIGHVGVALVFIATAFVPQPKRGPRPAASAVSINHKAAPISAPEAILPHRPTSFLEGTAPAFSVPEEAGAAPSRASSQTRGRRRAHRSPNVPSSPVSSQSTRSIASSGSSRSPSPLRVNWDPMDQPV